MVYYSINFLLSSQVKSKHTNDEGGNKYYLIYRIIAFLMHLNQPLSEILTLDINEASEIIRQYKKLTATKSKPSKPKGLPKIDYSQQKKPDD